MDEERTTLADEDILTVGATESARRPSVTDTDEDDLDTTDDTDADADTTDSDTDTTDPS